MVGVGSQLGPFRIERELGRGAVGVVYLAHDTKLDRPVAIKSLPAEVMENPKARSRFTREAQVLASLNHPNIATIYDEFQETEDVAYLILEYIPGQTFHGKGQYQEAEQLFVKVLMIRQRVLGEEHPDTLKTMNNLIELYEVWDKPEKTDKWRAKLPRKKDTQ